MGELLVLVALFAAWYAYAEMQAKRENEAWQRGLAEDRRRATLTDEQRAAEGLPSAYDEITILVAQHCRRFGDPLPTRPLFGRYLRSRESP
jgi:hypothetical protein